MVWATPRKAPNKEYLELELQPAANKPYTPIPTQQRKKITLLLKDIKLKKEGMLTHTSKESPILKPGAPK